MIPLSSSALAANALELFSFWERFINVASRLKRSPDGILAEMQEMKAGAEDLEKTIALANETLASDPDESLQAICLSAGDLAKELLKSIESVRGSPGRMITRTMRILRKESEFTEIQSRLSHLRLQLIAHFAAESQQTQYHMDSTLCAMAKRLVDIEKNLEIMNRAKLNENVDHTGEMRQYAGERKIELQGLEEPTLISSTTKQGTTASKTNEDRTIQLTRTTATSTGQTRVHTVYIPPKQSQTSFIHANPPSRFRCGEVRCVCICHLNQYVKTPLFLKMFVGALTFRGTCRNHTSNLWELKYWIPEWISNYNVYFLFEKNACGSPSLGLKFQRKVSWGAEDTIIRFSLLGDCHGIKSVLESGTGSLDDVDPNHGRSALHYAVMKNHVDACKFLLEAGADRFIEDESNMSATQKAWEHVFTKRGPPEFLEALKTMFPDEEWIIGRMEGLVLSQLFNPDTTIPDIDAVDTYQRTALHWASLRGDLEAVEKLLTAGARVDVTDSFKCTPLLYAVSAAVPRIVELLILSGAKVNITNSRGDSPLHYAARHKNDLASVEILVRAGAQIDRTNALGNTPFSGAAIMNRVAIGKYLLKYGANRHSRNKYGDTPLRETIQHNCHEFLQMLLEVETNCNDINKHGSSLLHTLALEGDLKTIHILSNADLSTLDIELANVQGYKAMDVCLKRVGTIDAFKAAFADLLSSIALNSTTTRLRRDAVGRTA